MYVYPKLSDIDLQVTRIGGLGLGNMLFTYARALLYARDYGAQMIWPTWNSIPVGQILRREDNKRYYNDLFRNNLQAIGGLQKLLVLATHRKVSEQEAMTTCRKTSEQEALSTYRKVGEQEALATHQMGSNRETMTSSGADLEKDVVVFTGMEGEFTPILGKDNSRYIYENLKNILQESNQKALSFAPGNGICMHVRLGDFTRATEADLQKGNPNLSIPIQWYVRIVQQLRDKMGDQRAVYVFSDGTEEELRPLLELGNVQRVTFGTAIGDILAMAGSELFIASGSTFSRWVRYLGRMNTITYPGQLKQKLLDEDEAAWEIEALELPDFVDFPR